MIHLPRRVLYIIGVSCILLIVVSLAVLLTRPNPHYVAGMNYLKIKEFDNAQVEFKLCLQQQENNYDAKAMLLYANIRRYINDSGDESEKIRKRIIFLVEEGLRTMFLADRFRFDSPTMHGADWKKLVKEEKSKFRNQLREYRVYTRDWDETKEVVIRAIRLISDLEVDTDDDYDGFFNSICMALMIRNGSEDLAPKLVNRAVEDPEIADLFHIAGNKLIPSLREELRNKESLLRKNGMEMLRDFCEGEIILQFVSEHPNLRRIRRSDFKGKDRIYWDRYVSDWMNTAWKSYLRSCWYYDEYQNKLPLGVFFATTVEFNDGESAICLVNGYDAEKHKFCGQLFIWDNDKLFWQPITFIIRGARRVEFESPHIFFLTKFFEDENQITIKVYRGESKKVTETDYRTVTVTRYREENDYWSGRRMVPYTTTESVPYEVSRIKDVIISELHLFELNPEKREFKFIDKNEQVID